MVLLSPWREIVTEIVTEMPVVDHHDDTVTARAAGAAPELVASAPTSQAAIVERQVVPWNGTHQGAPY